MKRIVAAVLLLVVLFITCSCAGTADDVVETTGPIGTTSGDGTTDDSKVTPPSQEAPPTPSAPDDTVKEQNTYLSAEVSAEMERYFKDDFYHFAPYSTSGAPYALQDEDCISRCRNILP